MSGHYNRATPRWKGSIEECPTGNEKRKGRGGEEGERGAQQSVLNSARKTQDRMESKGTVPEKSGI